MEKKIVGIMVCVLAIVSIAGVAEAQDITTDLVAHWKLDETSGITAYDSVGSNDGTLVGTSVGSPSWVSGGAIGGAIDFPTAMASSDAPDEYHHVDCGNDTSLNLLTGSLTVSACNSDDFLWRLALPRRAEQWSWQSDSMHYDELIRAIRLATETCNSTMHMTAYWHFLTFQPAS